MKRENRNEGLQVARGLKEPDLVFKNANVINVLTEEILQQDVAICNGIIAGVGIYHAENEIDLTGKYIAPGFIDSHLHLESTLVTPNELLKEAVKCGTTTFIVDPHESANVSGMAGIDYILRQTRDVEANVYIMIPSCVPSTDIDDNGFVLSADKMRSYLINDRILGLGEVMDYESVVNGEKGMLDKLDLFKGKVLDGHAPLLSDKDLSAYIMAGIKTDHECVDFEYAMKEKRNGMHVLIREGSAARNLEAIITGIVENNADTNRFCFCTDDKHIEDIIRDGHINYNIKKGISLGLDPIKAIKMATLHAAECYKLDHIGAIAPGYQADLVVFSDLSQIDVEMVFHKGKRVTESDFLHAPGCPEDLKETVRVKPFGIEELQLRIIDKKNHAIRMVGGEIITKDEEIELPGNEFFEPNSIINKVAVVERHKKSGKIGIGAVLGFEINDGAIASSVSHDSHNIIVIGDNDRDMLLAVNELIQSQGGYTIVSNGKVVETLALPIMGLMTDVGYSVIGEKLKRMIRIAHDKGVPEDIEPFVALSFLALPVIPEIRILPRGLYSVVENHFYYLSSGAWKDFWNGTRKEEC